MDRDKASEGLVVCAIDRDKMLVKVWLCMLWTETKGK